ncbi:E3 ubiquitin-protein ligase makorin-1 [Ceratobasidium sp. AG-Ba]|nr:E3 ubiquitin-protein ligase makorin-1 [Ceratobasidium sp. AG-Ba]
MNNVPRPPRPICRYFSLPGGCRAGSTCRYAHSAEPGRSPQQSKQLCRFYNNGHCRHGDQCWYLHATPESSKTSNEPAKVDQDDELVCAICFEEPKQFGLLTGCSHVFCLGCIKDWRNSKGKDVDVVISNTNKTCPVCRAPSKFITPSSRFTPKDSPERQKCVEGYKTTLGRIPCRYFAASSPEKRFCPYGRDCFYQHRNDDGTTHVFSEGVDAMMERHKSRMITSRDISAGAAMMQALMSSGFGHRWVLDHPGGLYESDDEDNYAGSDVSDLEWMPDLMF